MTLPSVETFERASLKAWPGIQVDWDGSWVRRSANGYTKRANSLQCFDPNDDDNVELRLAAACGWFAAQGIRPVVRTTPLQSASLTAVLDAEGWPVIDQSHLYAMALPEAEADGESQCYDVLDPEFLGAQQALQGHSDTTMAQMRALLSAMAVPAAGIVIYRDGAAVASGLMAVGDGILVTGNVITDPTRRRQGLGAAMMRTGYAWARSVGANIAALNVQADNAAGKALYQSLGYTHQYDYAYRIPGDAA